MRERLLVRHFLAQFVEHDLVSPQADRREVVSAVGGSLIAVSLFVSVLIALQYQFDNDLPPGLASLFSIDDRFLFVSASMLVMALLAVALWDGLALDDRDTAVFGVLPVPRALIVRSKFLAVALVGVVTCLAWNVAPVLLRAVSLPLKLPVHATGVIVLTLSQGLATMSAGAFGFLSVLGLREGLTAVLGRERFHAISASVQAILLVALTSALLMLPASSTGVARTWLAPGGIATKAFPPLWFVGLHETLAGSVLDDLPRTRPARFLVVRERNATDLYRSLRPLYHQLARWAIVALAIVAVVTVAACLWNNRRLPAPSIGRRRRAPSWEGARKWVLAHMLATSSLQQAGFGFTLQTLPRRAAHRAVLASALAVGLSLMLITVRQRMLAVQHDLTAVPLGILVAQSLMLVSVLTGFHHAVQMPADLRGSTTFSLAWDGTLPDYLSGVKRAGWLALVLPLLAVLFVWHSFVLGVYAASLHFVTGAVFSVLVLELLFLRYPRLPFVSAYIPDADLKSRGLVYVAAMWIACYVLAAFERLALSATPLHFLLLIATLVAATAGVAAFDRARRREALVLDLHEQAPPPTQRLNLAG